MSPYDKKHNNNSEVLEFSAEHLYYSLSNEFCTPQEVARMAHTKYFLRYLKHEDINTNTIVVEYGYTDGDYLDDYANYYVKCFRPYSPRCKRVHFFSMAFTDAEFAEIVRGNIPAEKLECFKDAYRGFIVVRPLPNAIIGRTVLATYSPGENNRRHYPCAKRCKANLFGIDLVVNSLEYQEQDSVLGACATVALWCCLHKTGEMFQTPVWSCATITRTANEVVHAYRSIPSHGLNPTQVHNAILRNGLAAEIIYPKTTEELDLVPLLYGYMRFGLPVILGVDIEDEGFHALTLTGYSLREEDLLPCRIDTSDESYIPFTASRIDHFYTHDDQVGPFSRLWVKPPKPTKRPGLFSRFRTRSSKSQSRPNRVVFDDDWKTKDGRICDMVPIIVIVALYHKIRVRFLDVQQWLRMFNWVLFGSAKSLKDSRLEWDVFLTTTNQLKRDIKETYQLEDGSLDDLLFSHHPHFIWRAILKCNNESLLDLLIDATDMSRSFPVYHIITHNVDLRSSLIQFINNPNHQTILEETITSPFVKLLKERL